MEQTIVDSVQLGGSVDTDLSIVGLFLAADPVVKVVMLGLIIVSIFTWAIIFFQACLVLIPFWEEPDLENRFGEAYLKYKRKVPRLIPKLKSEPRAN